MLIVYHYDNYCVLFSNFLKFLGLLIGKLERECNKLLAEELFKLFLYMTPSLSSN